MNGRMLTGVKLLGTELELSKGQVVELIPATNQPDKTQFFASLPSWGENSILISASDVELLPKHPADLFAACQQIDNVWRNLTDDQRDQTPSAIVWAIGVCQTALAIEQQSQPWEEK